MSKELAVNKWHPMMSRFLKQAEKLKLTDSIVNPSYSVEYINTGSTVLNMLIGGSRLPDGSFVCPGWPRGAIVEIIGRESSGKSTIALTAIGQALQDPNANCLYVDLECAVKDNYAVKLGADFRPPDLGGTGRAIRVSPHTAEETEALVMAAVLQGFALVVIDSVAGLVSSREILRDPTDPEQKKGIAEIPRFMSQWMPKLQQVIARTKTTVMFLNQTRDKIGAKGFTEEALKSTTGGNALKFWAHVRFWLKPKSTTKAKVFNPVLKTKEDVQIATDIEVKTVKNKIDAKQGHSGLITIRYGIGIDEIRTLLNAAIAYNVVKKDKKSNQDHFVFKSITSGTVIDVLGIEKFRLELLKNPEARDEMIQYTTDQIREGFKTLDDEALAALHDDAVTSQVHDDDEDEFSNDSPPVEVDPLNEDEQLAAETDIEV